MREDRTVGRGMGWITVSVVAGLMVGLFVLAGGLGLGQGAAPLAVKRSYANGDRTGIVSIILANSCADSPTISGQVNLSKRATGIVRLGLFSLSQDPAHQFTDTGRRVTATFSNSTSASYGFAPFTPIADSPAYLVRVLDASQNIFVPGYFTQSLAIPVCQAAPTKPVTATTTSTAQHTTTATQTNTTTATVTSTAVAPDTTTTETVHDTTTAPGTTTTETVHDTTTVPGTTTTETAVSTTSVVSTAFLTTTTTVHDTTTYTVTAISPTTMTLTATQTLTTTVLSPTTHTVTVTVTTSTATTSTATTRTVTIH